VRAKNKMLSLAALLTNTLLFIFLNRITHNIFVCATTRASEKRHKKVSRNAELTDYAKSSAGARSPIISSLCACDAMRAGLPNEQKVLTKRGCNRACFWNEFHALPSPQSTLIYLPSEQQQRKKTNQMK
jgi:hypothetical protein